MSKNKYNVHHKRQTLENFQKDIHEFHFEYNEKNYIATCISAATVEFDDEVEANLPEEVLCEVQKKIYEMMDKYEGKWRLPNGAQEIANAYCAEEFY